MRDRRLTPCPRSADGLDSVLTSPIGGQTDSMICVREVRGHCCVGGSGGCVRVPKTHPHPLTSTFAYLQLVLKAARRGPKSVLNVSSDDQESVRETPCQTRRQNIGHPQAPGS
jgi:hypothetical protein